MYPSADRSAFVEKLRADPADRTTALAFADWLRDRDEELLADALQAGAAEMRIYEVPIGTVRRRRYLLWLPGPMGMMEVLAAAHLFGVPRPGDPHPVYATAMQELHVSALGPFVMDVICEYDG